MKCRVCNSDVLDIFLFCHSCGSSLKDRSHSSLKDQNVTGGTVAAGRPGNAAVEIVGPSPSSHPSTARGHFPRPSIRPIQLPRFEDFRKRVSAERAGELLKKKKLIQEKEVLVNIGMMKNRGDGTLSAIKGKTMSL